VSAAGRGGRARRRLKKSESVGWARWAVTRTEVGGPGATGRAITQAGGPARRKIKIPPWNRVDGGAATSKFFFSTRLYWSAGRGVTGYASHSRHMLRVVVGDQSAFPSMPATNSPPRSGQFLSFCRCGFRTRPLGDHVRRVQPLDNACLFFHGSS
jgi:hypothetical protein